MVFGLIPARAGNTAVPPMRRSPQRAHPRSRGEHMSPRAPHALSQGSSPLARGTRAETGTNIRIVGLIPARAGNTGQVPAQHQCCGAHPRSRGEHSKYRRLPHRAWGSSPLARGTPPELLKFRGVLGLIPARAGNTLASAPYAGRERAHPRSRGEHTRLRSLTTAPKGSSPLARGTQSPDNRPHHGWGLIPARAGNTNPHALACGGTGAHPRSRGEHMGRLAALRGSRGSSPLARGTPSAPTRIFALSGLIPARAGNTGCSQRGCTPQRAHPRSRGEHSCPAAGESQCSGSSPLARGTHLLTWGFTPYISKIESLWRQSLHPEYTISNHY